MKKLTIFIAVSVVFFVSLFQFGNPQWHKLIYIYQAYYFPGSFAYPDGYISVDEDYTGTYQSWYKSGNKKSEGEVVNGKDVGIYTNWNEFGKLDSKFHRDNTGFLYKIENFHHNGKLRATFPCAGFNAMEGRVLYDGTVEYYDKDGILHKTEKWKMGRRLSQKIHNAVITEEDSSGNKVEKTYKGGKLIREKEVVEKPKLKPKSTLPYHPDDW